MLYWLWNMQLELEYAMPMEVFLEARYELGPSHLLMANSFILTAGSNSPHSCSLHRTASGRI